LHVVEFSKSYFDFENRAKPSGASGISGWVASE